MSTDTADTIAPENKRLLKVGDVANLIQCRPGAIYRWVKNGKFPSPIKCGHLIRWRIEDLENWIRNQPTKIEGN